MRQKTMEGEKKKFDSNTIIIVVAILIAAVIIGGSIIASGSRNSDTNSKNGEISGLDIGDSPVLGDEDAEFTIVEFLDFQCPVCEKFSTEIEPKIRTDFVDTKKAKLVYKILTFIDSFDNFVDPKESLLSAKAGECAKEQGKFVEMHDAIFSEEAREATAGKNPENSGNLITSFFDSTAKLIGLDTGKFSDCMKSDNVEKNLQVYSNDAQAAMGERVYTPAVFINGKKVNNPFDITEYQKIIK